ncbi:hypothetical protein KAI92_00035 [Candidatus Parcubacteria bacterium]|nr:hypothetical protein [Candidatus Parcubacteria bacterium]
MKKNSLIIGGVAALVTLVAVGGFVTSAFAYQGDPNVKSPNYTPERCEIMTAAFANADYDAWVEAKGDVAKGRIMEVINEENFGKFIEIRNLRLAGDTEKANELRAELGLGKGSKGEGHGMRNGDGEKRGGGKGMRNTGGASGQNAN